MLGFLVRLKACVSRLALHLAPAGMLGLSGEKGVGEGLSEGEKNKEMRW